MSSRQHPWPSTQWFLVAPRCWLGMFGSHAISVAGESVLNSLPDSLLDLALSKDDFRHLLKTHLITLYWSIWRIRGVTWWYTVQMDNFLTWSLIRRVICRKFRKELCRFRNLTLTITLAETLCLYVMDKWPFGQVNCPHLLTNNFKWNNLELRPP